MLEKACSIGLRSIDEDEPARIEPGLPGFPALAPTRDIGASLFESKQCFFEPRPFSAQEQPVRVVLATASCQFRLQTVSAAASE